MAQDVFTPDTRRGRTGATDSLRLVIADDHPVLRYGVKRVLAHAPSPGYTVVAEEDHAPAALSAVRRLKPDVLLLDVSMPPASGLDVLQQCIDVHPPLATVVFTMHREIELVRRAVAAGARAYVLKDAPAGELLTALRLAARGSTYLPPGAARSLADAPAAHAPVALDMRERAIVRLIALGYTGTEIAAELGMSERTVKNHRARVAEKLGVHQRHELTRWALRHGLLSVDSSEPSAGGLAEDLPHETSLGLATGAVTGPAGDESGSTGQRLGPGASTLSHPRAAGAEGTETGRRRQSRRFAATG